MKNANFFSMNKSSPEETTKMEANHYSNQIVSINDVLSMKCPHCDSDVNEWLHLKCSNPIRFSENLDGNILCEYCNIEKSFFNWDFLCGVHKALEKDLDLMQQIDFLGRFEQNFFKSPSSNMREVTLDFLTAAQSNLKKQLMNLSSSNQNYVLSMKCPQCDSDVNRWLHSKCLNPIRFSKNLGGSILCEYCHIEKNFFNWEFSCRDHQVKEKDLDLMQQIDFLGSLEQNYFKSPSSNKGEGTLDFLAAAQLKLKKKYLPVPPIIEELNLAYDKINRNIDKKTPPAERKVKMINLQLTAQKQMKKIVENVKALEPQEQIFVVDKGKNVEKLMEEKVKMMNIIEDLKKTKKKLKNIEKEKSKYSEREKEIDTKSSLIFLLQMVLEADKKVFDGKLQQFESVTKNSESQLKIDSYLFTSEIIDFVVLFLSCIGIYVLLTGLVFLSLIIHPICICLNINPFLRFDQESFLFLGKFYFYMIPILGFSLFLLLPGVLVVFTQGFCLLKLAEEQNSESSAFEMGLNFISMMHLFFILFYLFLSLKKLKSSMKSLSYLLKVIYITWTENAAPEVDPNNPNSISERRWSYVKKIILLFLDTTRIIPTLVQIFFCFCFLISTLTSLRKSKTQRI